MIAAVLLTAALADASSQAAERRGKPFWTALSKDCAVPAGETAGGLVNEAVGLLGSPDSEWRDARFAAKDHARLLDAVWAKLTTPGTPVFTHAEAERLAATLVSLVRRTDFDAASLDPWLQRFPALEKELWAKSPPDAAALDASENARHLLQAFYVLLSLPEPAAAGSQAAAREKALATLAKIRR